MNFDDSTEGSQSDTSWDEQSLGNHTDNTYGTLTTGLDEFMEGNRGALRQRADASAVRADILVLEDGMPEDPAYATDHSPQRSLHHSVLEEEEAQQHRGAPVEDNEARPPSRHGRLATLPVRSCSPAVESPRLAERRTALQSATDSDEENDVLLRRMTSARMMGDDRSSHEHSISGSQECDPITVEDTSRWDDRLTEMVLIDYSQMCQLYQCSAEVLNEEEEIVDTESILKVICFYPNRSANGAGAHAQRSRILDSLQDLLQEMKRTQSAFSKAGLMIPCAEEDDTVSDDANTNENPVCRGYRDLHLDSSCRVIAKIDVEPYSVSLANVMAFVSTPLSMIEYVSVLRSVVVSVGKLHKYRLAHGSLHAGNVLFSTNDGHCTLSQPGGIMSNSLFPHDPSYLSPRQCSKFRSVFSALDHQIQQSNVPNWRIGESRLKNHEETILFLMEALRVEEEDSSSSGTSHDRMFPPFDPPEPADDVYAIGVLALFLLFGVPVMHGKNLRGVATLLSHAQTCFHDTAPSSTRRIIAKDAYGPQKEVLRRLFYGKAWESAAARCRFDEGHYDLLFLEDAEDFILQCLLTGFLVVEDGSVAVNTPASTSSAEVFPRSAHALLQHHLFSRLDDMVTDDILPDEYMQDVVHRVVYPIYTTEQHIIKQCGTTPYIPRLHRNSIFSSRCNALLLHTMSGICSADRNACYPFLYGRSPSWARGRVGLEAPPLSLSRKTSLAEAVEGGEDSGVERLDFLMISQEHRFPLTLKEKRAVSEFDEVFRHNSGFWMYTNQNGTSLRIRREDTLQTEGKENGVLKGLILADLSNCKIEITTPFLFIVLMRLNACDIHLAPCVTCYMNEVDDSLVNIAATYLLVSKVEQTKLNFSGLELFPLVPKHFQPAAIRPYGFTYPGVSEDFSRMGLPQEHSGSCKTLLNSGCDLVSQLTTTHRTFHFSREHETHYDFPYAHALAALGNKFIHKGDNIHDVYLMNDEIEGKDVWIADINGNQTNDVDSDKSLTADCQHGQNTSEKINSCTTTDGKSFPLICILSAVGDITIEDCCYCTVVVVGSSGSVSIQRCKNMTIVFLCRECVLEDCADMNVMAVVTEYFVLKKCSNIDVQPLFIQCPNFDTIFENVIEQTEDEDQATVLRNAFAKRQWDGLNVILPMNEDVMITESQGVRIRDRAWYAQHPKVLPYLITIWVPDNTSSMEDARLSSVLDSIRLPTNCHFMEDCVKKLGGKASEHFTLCMLYDILFENYSNKDQADLQKTRSRTNNGFDNPISVLTPHRLHDLVDAFVLRVPQSLNIRSPNALAMSSGTRASDGDPSLLISSLLIQRIFGGEIHLVAAVKRLTIRDCHGPLEIAVCAVEEVYLEHCNNITLRVAAVRYSASHCYHCHASLHVNTPPVYRSCEGMITSPLNMTAAGMEHFMTLAHVKAEINVFDDFSAGGSTTTPTAPSSTGQEGHAALNALSSLRGSVALVPPLPGLCLGVEESPFLEFLESAVRKEEFRTSIQLQWAHALCAVVAHVQATPTQKQSLCSNDGVVEEDATSSPQPETTSSEQLLSPHSSSPLEDSVQPATQAEVPAGKEAPIISEEPPVRVDPSLVKAPQHVDPAADVSPLRPLTVELLPPSSESSEHSSQASRAHDHSSSAEEAFKDEAAEVSDPAHEDSVMPSQSPPAREDSSAESDDADPLGSGGSFIPCVSANTTEHSSASPSASTAGDRRSNTEAPNGESCWGGIEKDFALKSLSLPALVSNVESHPGVVDHSSTESSSEIENAHGSEESGGVLTQVATNVECLPPTPNRMVDLENSTSTDHSSDEEKSEVPKRRNLPIETAALTSGIASTSNEQQSGSFHRSEWSSLASEPDRTNVKEERKLDNSSFSATENAEEAEPDYHPPARDTMSNGGSEKKGHGERLSRTPPLQESSPEEQSDELSGSLRNTMERNPLHAAQHLQKPLPELLELYERYRADYEEQKKQSGGSLPLGKRVAAAIEKLKQQKM